jgi:hypothetical protein
MALKKATAKKRFELPPRLTEVQADLLQHMQHGYQLETSSLEGVLLRRLKDNEVMRPASANLSTVKALEECGLIRPAKGRDPLTTVCRTAKARE